MSFLTWISTSLFVDISFVVFACASVWKIRKLEAKIDDLKEDMILVLRNPTKARKVLNKKPK